MKAVAMNLGCSTRAIRHLRQRFQATRRTEDRTHAGRLRVKMRGQDRFILNTHLRNRFKAATATAANIHGTHNNRIPTQTVHNRFPEAGLSDVVHILVVFLVRRHRVNLVNWARIRQCWLRQQWISVVFSDESR